MSILVPKDKTSSLLWHLDLHEIALFCVISIATAMMIINFTNVSSKSGIVFAIEVSLPGSILALFFIKILRVVADRKNRI